ncbi:hypothetical protein C414_000080071 [Campylobacter jejuni subsp. jejuni 414]|nr:hypothetical protein C414_000080071 [Campylobacter jejuni subsp. jejuni 414]
MSISKLKVLFFSALRRKSQREKAVNKVEIFLTLKNEISLIVSFVVLV